MNQGWFQNLWTRDQVAPFEYSTTSFCSELMCVFTRCMTDRDNLLFFANQIGRNAKWSKCFRPMFSARPSQESQASEGSEYQQQLLVNLVNVAYNFTEEEALLIFIIYWFKKSLNVVSTDKVSSKSWHRAPSIVFRKTSFRVSANQVRTDVLKYPTLLSVEWKE